MTVDWGDAPAWAAIGVSGLLSLAAFVVSLHGLKWQKQAAQAAMRSANADETIAALTQLTASLQAAAPSPEPSGQNVEWRLERRKDRFILRNTGSAVATGVTVGGPGVAEAATELPVAVAVRPGGSVSFWMVGTLAHSVPDEIEVTWDGHPKPVILPVPNN